MTETIGCTTPYVKNKSKICQDQEKALEAIILEAAIFQNEKALSEICPRSCWEVHANFGSKESYNNRASSRPTGTPFRGGTSVFKTKTAKIENVRAT